MIAMDDLRRRFASLDRVPAPDLWGQVEQRAAAMGPVARVSGGRHSRCHSPPRRSTARSVLVYLAAAAVLTALVAGAVTVGSGLVKLPAIVPAPSESASAVAPTPVPSNTPEPSETASGRAAPWVAFSVQEGSGLHSNGHVWAIRADGSGAHAIASGSSPVAWSPDGTRLLMNDGHILVAEVGDQIGPFTEAGIDVPDGQQWEAFDFARDDERVVFVQKSKCPKGPSATGSASSRVVLAAYVAETAGANCYVLSIIDLRTGARTELDRTLVKDQTPVENRALELPAWSPDGTKIAYTRLDEPLDIRELWIVNADGSNPAKVELDADVSRHGASLVAGRQPGLVHLTDVAVGDGVGLGRLRRRHPHGTRGARHDRIRTQPLASCVAPNGSTTATFGSGTRRTRTAFWLATLGASPPEARLLADLTDALAANDPPLRGLDDLRSRRSRSDLLLAAGLRGCPRRPAPAGRGGRRTPRGSGRASGTGRGPPTSS